MFWNRSGGEDERENKRLLEINDAVADRRFSICGFVKSTLFLALRRSAPSCGIRQCPVSAAVCSPISTKKSVVVQSKINRLVGPVGLIGLEI